MSDVVIKAEALGKKYMIGHQAENGSYLALRDVLAQNARGLWRKTRDLAQGKPIILGDTQEEMWALKDVSFEVRRGEAVGVIGRNGAGKSTLLKILSRITEPSSGRVTIRGRVASLLEVGTGFHPELTGRENIYLNGAILGMTRIEIKRKFDEIVAFAEIEKFLDTPVKRYSSGMYVRLAFAVAAHLEPEILLVDEVLAVGDAEFQKKCLGKMRDVADEGRTVVFISHNMLAIQTLCTEGVLLAGGKITASGPIMSVIDSYVTRPKSGHEMTNLGNYPRTGGTGKATIHGFRMFDTNQRTTSSVLMGEGLQFEIDYSSSIPLDHADFVIGVYGSMLQPVFQLSSATSGNFLQDGSHQGTVRCRVPVLNLMAGRYYVNLAISSSDRTEVYDHLSEVAILDILEADIYESGRIPDIRQGYCFMAQEWSPVGRDENR